MSSELMIPEDVKQQVSIVEQQANNLVIASPEDQRLGAELLHSIKDASKAVKARKEGMTRPIMAGLASIRDFFKPFETTLGNAEDTVKGKLLAFQEIEDTRIATDLARVETRVEKGTMRPDTAMEKVATIEASKSVKPATMQVRVIKKVRVMDETMVPVEYMLPNMPKITEAVIRQGISIPGVELYEEKTIASL